MDRRAAVDTVVFDFGGVLIDWDPRYVYRTVFSTSDEMERFLDSVCTPDWNLQMDAGRPFAEGIAELSERHPEYAAEIAAFWQRWPEMLGETIPGMFALVESLREEGYRTFGLTNWSAETFPYAWRSSRSCAGASTGWLSPAWRASPNRIPLCFRS